MKRRALVTGCTGQDGSYMCELLLEKDYEVYGLVRRTSLASCPNLQQVKDRITLLPGDLTDSSSLTQAIIASHPHEIYNFAAQTYVGTSFIEPLHTADVTGLGALRLFDAVRLRTSVSEHVRVYQASSSEMFGESTTMSQNESTSFHPVSPYGCAKVFAHQMAHLYRSAYGMYIACGIAFNHESPRRGPEFVTRKITQAIGAIHRGEQSELRLGNCEIARDWLHARDVVRAAWQMLQLPEPQSLVIASGITRPLREFLDKSFAVVGLTPEPYTRFDPLLRRPNDIAWLCGNAHRLHEVTGWTPEISFEALVTEMVQYDCTESHHSVRAGG